MVDKQAAWTTWRFLRKIVLSFPVPINQADSLLCNHIDV